ncbi:MULTISPECIES: L,D-transpeptidase [unclassified Roseitalea]|uniref:L,D-transpeptidase n=1 Tax=unclassified Roseitalea TaxID=2639107 RepID=UPI00273F1605|nr:MULTISPECIES: L,D-transpeptidase [unclassified Roseitalea]
MALVATAIAPASALAASLVVTIDLSEQRLYVRDMSGPLHAWPVSTARSGYCTPVGTYRPIRLERMWYSRKYDNAPMPHSIFFHGGYAIHGTTETGDLGRPASHGCVRLHPDNARTLFDLVVAHGMAATRIVIRN